MNSSLPPIPVPDPSKSTIQVISSSRSSTKKIIYIVLSIIISLAAISAAVYFIGFRQFFASKASDCNSYQFRVSKDGEVSVVNDSNTAESAQKVSLSINNTPVAILDVPSLSIGASSDLGQIAVPVSKVFTWDAVGTIACSNHGSYTLANPTPTTEVEILPTATPETTPNPTSEPLRTSAFTFNPTATPRPRNNCGGTCELDSECVTGLICNEGFCRRAACPDSESCTCALALATYNSPTPTPPSQLAQTGAMENTFLLAAGSLLLIGLGVLLAF